MPCNRHSNVTRLSCWPPVLFIQPTITCTLDHAFHQNFIYHAGLSICARYDGIQSGAAAVTLKENYKSPILSNMESARAVLETPRSSMEIPSEMHMLAQHTVEQKPVVTWPERKQPLLIRVKRRLYQWEQMILGELLAWTLPATDFRRR
jgi:hypothetical protein